jgi:hypothetical protein
MRAFAVRYSVVNFTGAMASGFRDPAFRLGFQASDVLEAFYRALEPTQRLALSDLLTFGGNTYGDLKLAINTFGGAGRIEITAKALIVELRNLGQLDIDFAKHHLHLCEDTLKSTLEKVISNERQLRANLWLALVGGADQAEELLARMGNSAFKLSEGRYASLTTEFTLQFSGLRTESATKVGVLLEKSRAEGDLFIQFDHTCYGTPNVTLSVLDQFADAESELEAILVHLGLDRNNDPSQS